MTRRPGRVLRLGGALALAVASLAGMAAHGSWARPVLGLTLVAVNDAYSTVHDRTLVVPAPGVLANDVGLLGSPTAVRDSGPSHGDLALASNGGFTYIPDAGYVGTDSFRYHVHDGLLNSTPATVTITVTNAIPVAVPDAYTTKEETTLHVAAPGVLKNDTDADGDQLRAELDGGISNGSIDLNPDGSFTYDPGGSFTGVTTFEYRACDDIGCSQPGTVTITVTPIPVPTPPPSIVPTPLPTVIPTPLPSILPTLPPTPRPTLPPTPRPSPTATPTPTPDRPSPSVSPVTAVVPTAGRGGGASAAEGPFALPDLRIDPFDDRFTGVDGFVGVEWAVPAIALGVPGILLILAILTQAAMGVVWLPIVRRHLAGVGIRRRAASRTSNRV